MFQMLPFMEYSISKDKLFCFTCRKFSSGLGNSENGFTKYEYSDWKNIKRSLILHTESKEHKLNAEKWLNLQKSKTCGSICSILSSTHDMEIKQKKTKYFTKICVHQYLWKQGLA